MKDLRDSRKHRSFWLDWFGSLGREIGSSKSWFTDNPNIFLSTVESCIGNRKPCFMSVHPFRSPSVVFGLEKIFFDFDSNMKHPNWKDTFKEVRGLTKRLKEHFDVESLIVRTWRGFHVYVLLQSVLELDFGQAETGKWVYQLLQEELLREAPHTTLNTKCLGNLKQLTRVPYSTHEAGVKCPPIGFHGRPILIDDLGEYREGGINKGLFRQLVEVGAEKRGNSQFFQFSLVNILT